MGLAYRSKCLVFEQVIGASKGELILSLFLFYKVSLVALSAYTS